MSSPKSRFREFLFENGLSLVLLALFALSFLGQTLSGYRVLNEDREQHGREPVSYGGYLLSGDSMEATFENWESEFLQMAMYVLLTIPLRQRGASESKKIDEDDEVDEDPRKHRNDPEAPWPVKRGGWVLKLYEWSLSLALGTLFLLSMVFHAIGGARKHCEENAMHGQPCESLMSYAVSSQFWFESFQNWQSEFLSVGVLIVLSIFLRQRGSPESKPVHAPHHVTGH